MEEEKLYRCCNTCKHKADNFYGCNIPEKYFNGFSAYEPNEKMEKQIERGSSFNDEE